MLLSFGWDILGDGATVLYPGKCIFQDIILGKVGMKSSTVVENEEFCIQCFMNQMVISG